MESHQENLSFPRVLKSLALQMGDRLSLARVMCSEFCARKELSSPRSGSSGEVHGRTHEPNEACRRMVTLPDNTICPDV